MESFWVFGGQGFGCYVSLSDVISGFGRLAILLCADWRYHSSHAFVATISVVGVCWHQCLRYLGALGCRSLRHGVHVLSARSTPMSFVRTPKTSSEP